MRIGKKVEGLFEQITLNTQKQKLSSSFADFALYASHDPDSKALERLSKICRDTGIKPVDLLYELKTNGRELFTNGEIEPFDLFDFMQKLSVNKSITEGMCPDQFTQQAQCKQCGPIWFNRYEQLTECPWCARRLKKESIPRPSTVQCGECKNFSRTKHPFLGHCLVGEPEAPAGLVDSDNRYCEYFEANND